MLIEHSALGQLVYLCFLRAFEVEVFDFQTPLLWIQLPDWNQTAALLLRLSFKRSFFDKTRSYSWIW